MGDPGPDDGTSTHRPCSPNVQPWYAQVSAPWLYVPIERGACRCGHLSGATIRSPFCERHRTRFSPRSRVEWGLSVTSADSATGYQAVCSGARSANVCHWNRSSPRDHSRLVRPTDHLRHSIVRSVTESNEAATPSAIARSYLESFATSSAEADRCTCVARLCQRAHLCSWGRLRRARCVSPAAGRFPRRHG